MNYLRNFLSLFILLTSFTLLEAQRSIMDSGGELSQEQAAYDVTFYDLELDVMPDKQMVDGTLTMQAKIVANTNRIVMDLDTMLAVHSIKGLSVESQRELKYKVNEGSIEIDLDREYEEGEQITVEVKYGGQPRVAVRPPWGGGFTWSKTKSGKHWIATTCQTEGADLWWPCKDHISDEPDSMGIHITVPEELVVASNGQLRAVEKSEGKATYHWLSTNPINHYTVALNIAPYEVIEQDYTSVTGESFPVKFWVLPEDLEKGEAFFPEIVEHLRFFEETVGPYPFRSDKYGVAQTPHLGMEHQTIIAYGANFKNNSMTGRDWGYDDLHHHELAHEWWGNLVTAASNNDLWIHEGIGTYMQLLYVEKIQSFETFQDFKKRFMRSANRLPVASRQTLTNAQAFRAPIYSKGAAALHTLRYAVGDEVFFNVLRRMAYPDERLEATTDGSQTRFASTEEFQALIERSSDRDLSGLFEMYFYDGRIPKLIVSKENALLKLKWDAIVDLELPVQVLVGDSIQSVEMVGGFGEIEVGELPVEVDPLFNILCSIEREAIRMPLKQMQEYVGDYHAAPDFNPTIKVQDDRLVITYPDGRLAKMTLEPIEQDRFIWRMKNIGEGELNFSRQDGDVDGFKFSAMGQEIIFQKKQ